MAPEPRESTRGLALGLWALFYLLTLGACAALPPLKPPLAGTLAEPPFPQGRWQLVHRIEARFPGNHKALMMGALELDSASGRLSCALMTVEGFTLFRASRDPVAPAKLSIIRAVPPFDGPGFAEGLMADLGLIFFAPRNARRQIGRVDQKPVWRYHRSNGTTTDVKALSTDRFRIDHYNANAKQVRRAVLSMRPSSVPGEEIAREILLEALGDAGYTLKLDLIDAVPLKTDNGNDISGPDPKDAS
jgi:hypothetical protein